MTEQPLFPICAPIITKHMAARPVKPGLLADAGFNGQIGPAKSRDERVPFGWVGEQDAKTGEWEVHRGCGFIVLAWLAPGQECRISDRMILDHSGMIRATNLNNTYAFTNVPGGGYFYAPIIGQTEESITKPASMTPEQWIAEGPHRVYVKSLI